LALIALATRFFSAKNPSPLFRNPSDHVSAESGYNSDASVIEPFYDHLDDIYFDPAWDVEEDL
jgi:hypothetical protein